MAPPITSASTLVIRFSSRSSLVETLAPPTMATTGRFGVAERLRQRFELGLHGAARIGRELVAKPFGRGMRAMRGGEGVVDPEVAELGERCDEGRIVLLLALVEARVLQAQDVAGFIAATAASAFGPMQSSAKATGRFDHLLDGGGDRLQRLLRVAGPSAGRNARAG